MKNNSKLNTENKTNIELDKYQKVKTFDYLKSIKFKEKPFKKIDEFFKQKLKKRQIFMIIMQTNNGKYDMFTVTTSTQHFIYQSGTYYLDPDMVRENVHAKMNTLFYHQGCSSPFKINFDISELKEKLAKTNSDVEKAINPLSLKAFINSQVIEKVLKGAEMIKELSQIKLMVLINLVITIGLAFVIAKSMGWV